MTERSSILARRRRASFAVAALAAIAVVPTRPAPTGLGALDVVLVAVVCWLVVRASTIARRWTWVWCCGVASVAAPRPLLPLVAFGLAVSVASLRKPLRNSFYGAVATSCAVVSLSRLGAAGPHGFSLILAGAAFAPVVASALAQLSARSRGKCIRLASVLAGYVTVSSVLFVFVALDARADLSRASELARQGLTEARRGEGAEARGLLQAAHVAFRGAQRTFASPLLWPTRAVPVLAQQVAAAASVAETGAELAATGSRSAALVTSERLRPRSGRVDLDAVRALREPLAESRSALVRADRRLARVDSDWLLPPLAESLRSLRDDVRATIPKVRFAADAARIAPEMLGSTRPRRYLVLFTTPAESRIGGGFVGSYGILVADKGNLDLVTVERIATLNTHPGAKGRRLRAPADFLRRHARLQPHRYFQNVDTSPDFPTVARVAADLYTQTTGDRVDGVVSVDPHGLSALLRLTGPVQVPGPEAPLTAHNVADFLLRSQYVRFPDESEREELLRAAAEQTFEALTSRVLPGPERIARALGPALRDRRILLWSSEEEERRLLAEAEVDGAFPPDRRSLIVSLRQSNTNPAKIDAYLRRRILVSAETGEGGDTLVRVTAELSNEVDPRGLPDSVVGNRFLRSGSTTPPAGSNLSTISLYTGLDLVEARLDGRRTAVERQRELGLNVYSLPVVVPPGGLVRLEFEGRPPPRAGRPRELTVVPPPLANDDVTEVRVSSPTVSGRDPEGTKGSRGSGPSGSSLTVEGSAPVTVTIAVP
ncbi:MAG: hypothetical protein KatS3mg008_0445 [Acidimicrobiales bacterium]|nr:MAG: hypothetical protein KatS3mg008_0445 [Acidimicrobiales bacterium]